MQIFIESNDCYAIIYFVNIVFVFNSYLCSENLKMEEI